MRTSTSVTILFTCFAYALKFTCIKQITTFIFWIHSVPWVDETTKTKKMLGILNFEYPNEVLNTFHKDIFFLDFHTY